MRQWMLVGAAILAAILWWSLPAQRPEGVAEEPGTVASGEDSQGVGSGFAPTRPSDDSTAETPAATVASLPTRDGTKRSATAAGASLEVLVVSADEGVPIQEAMVRVTVNGTEETLELLTDPTGRALPRVEPGEYTVAVEMEGFLSQTFRLGLPWTGAPVRREIRLVAAVAVEGRVVDSAGEPIAGARVSFLSTSRESNPRRVNRATSSSADGGFVIDLPTGTYRVRASKRPHPYAELREVEVPAVGRPPLEIRMRLREDTVYLRGTVSDSDEERIEGATIRLRQRRSGRWRTLATSRTNGRGQFEIELLPATAVEVRASAAGYKGVTRRNVAIRRDSELSLKLEGYPTFAVRVFDSAGVPVDDARVHGIGSRGNRVLRRKEEGWYYTSTYPVRIYADAINRNLGVSREVLVNSYQPEVRLMLEPGSDLRGRVVSPDGTPVKSFTVSIRPAGLGNISRRFDAEDGSFYLRDLPPGQMTVSVTASGYERQRHDVTLDGNHASWLEIVLNQRRQQRDPREIYRFLTAAATPRPAP